LSSLAGNHDMGIKVNVKTRRVCLTLIRFFRWAVLGMDGRVSIENVRRASSAFLFQYINVIFIAEYIILDVI
jgi:hypothetical protein